MVQMGEKKYGNRKGIDSRHQIVIRYLCWGVPDTFTFLLIGARECTFPADFPGCKLLYGCDAVCFAMPFLQEWFLRFFT